MNTMAPTFERTGRLVRVQGSIHANLRATIGESVWIRDSGGRLVPAEVIGFDENNAQLMPLATEFRLSKGDLAIAAGSSAKIPVGRELLGRVLGATGQPIDGLGPLRNQEFVGLTLTPPAPMTRHLITRHFETGIRAIDGLLTIGRGQRVGIFSGSGVGKSTLLGNIARQAESDVNVVALVGERGREVRPFIEQSLGSQGLAKSVVIVSTSDESPLARIRAVESAIAIAAWFRGQGSNVLLMLDSMTRFAFAQRELGLLLNEPPTSRGYPPSVFQRMSSMLEQLGNSDVGSITGLITVLVDGDDMNDPVADAARSILDGHIVLDRRIAERNHYPAIDVLASISRLAGELTDSAHRRSAATIKQTIALFREVEDYLQIGAYKKGGRRSTDRAIDCMPTINQFLRQDSEGVRFEVMLDQLSQLAARCDGQDQARG